MADTSEALQWNVEMEVSLFHAMRGHKPVGVNRHFQMIYIHSKMNESSTKKISSDQIWKQLSTLYQLQALNESEILPFPNKETDFILPDSDYKDLKQKFESPRLSLVESSDIRDHKDHHKDHKDVKHEKTDKMAEVHSKGGKSGSHKMENKGTPTVQSSKEGKGSHSHHNKSDSKSHLTPQSTKDKLKEHLHSSHAGPKRKRTRHSATPNDTPPIKRRR
ncbi:MRG/MORF4L-binding protein-like [Patella vulgata]|uniref:MRG/MORF4L-binding protein-like n=1 Tax=Patella vulgata TaxID=6465 RepID=UPI0024A9FB34|nr:MRG/MORF4L-binding protein-like [Patella vulgata]